MQHEQKNLFSGKWVRWPVVGAALLVLGGFLSITPPGLLGKADGIGYAVCHRIEARSFHVHGRQLPLCARCTGEFNAAAITLIFLGATSRKRSGLPPKGLLALLAGFFLAFALDGSNSYLYLLKQTYEGFLPQVPNLYTPNNSLRLLTGTGMGVTMASLLYPVVNQSLWRAPDERPALTWKGLGALLVVLLLVDLGILGESAAVLYPIALVSVLGTLALLTMVFGMLWIIIMRQENAFESYRQLWLPALAGLTLALLLISGLDLFRLRLTGTWGGFPLGGA
ncbi:MAG: hypothetical protein Fur0043_10980 [Anaerolineales bacterium]